jgi:type I restriction enzyme S subunit
MSEVRNIPRLRFPVYLEEFKKIKLGDISDFISKGTTPKKFINEGVNYIKIESLLGLNIQKDKCTFISEKTHLNELKRSILEENDILFAIAGATIGKIGIVTKNILPANTNQALSIIRLKDKSCIPYVLQVLESKTMKKYIVQSISVGAQPNLNLKQIIDFEFYSPSISEQQKIADFLTVVDKRIELLKKKKTLLETYKKGVMKKIFNQEIRFKDDSGRDFPDWEEKRLTEVSKSISVKNHQIPSNNILSEGNIPVIDQGKDMVKGFSNQSEKTFRTDGVVVFGDHTTILKYIDFDFIVGGDGVKLISSNTIEMKYLYYNMIYNNVSSEGYKRHFSILKNIMIQIPNQEEQVKISEFLSSIDDQIELLVSQIDKSKTWKKGLLQKMFV